MNPTDLILVAVLNSLRDLEIARVLGWYRIPAKTAPRTLLVDFLAFYQTARFGEEKWAIHYVAPVKGHELAARRELLRTEPDHPRANAEYYKVQIGSLERLPRPIPSRKWRRVTFLYTTGERLSAAEEINDLIVQSAERETLWQALRERGLLAERQYPVRRAPAPLEVDFAVLCALGNLGIHVGDSKKLKESRGWQYLMFPESAVNADLPGVLGAIEQAVGRLGGPVR